VATVSPSGQPGVWRTPPDAARALCAGLVRAPERDCVLDPACGDGALLVTAWEAAGRSRRFAAEGLFGIEVDPRLAARARERLRSAIGGTAGARAAAHVLVADALDPRLRWPEGCAIAANPPWIGLSGRGAGRLPAVLRGLRGDASDRAPGGWPSVQAGFLLRIARHVAATGRRARVLLPAALCELAGYAPLRRAVEAHATLAAPPLELGEAVFRATTGPVVVIELVPARPARPSGERPWRVPPGADAALLARLAERPRLAPETWSDPGVHTGNCARELVVRGAHRSLPGLREGRDLAAYSLGPPRAALCADLPRSAGRRFRIAPLERLQSVPILVRQTADRPIAALHREPTYFRNSLLACRPADLDPRFALAVLNGPVATAWHRLSFGESRQRAFPQVKVAHLRSQPFAIAARDEDERLHDRVVELVRAGRHAEAERRVLAAYELGADAERRVLAIAGRAVPG
jgi:hypothetical protein